MMNQTMTLSQTGTPSLRSRQIGALKMLINQNQPVSSSIAVEPVWKVLIFDKFGQDVISPLMNVKELRDLGVTLHLSIDSIRESLPDVPAVYLIMPNETNVRIICQDFGAAMYESYYLNFITALGRPLLEELATAATQHSCVQQVQKVYDQYLSFISLEDDLFTLRRHVEENPLSFYELHRSDMTEESMNQLLDSIVDGLFSVCVTMAVVPIIRCPKNNAAEQVAQRLDKKLRDNLRDSRNNLFSQENIRAGSFSLQRPILIILDRSIDLASMLHHTWTYQAMVHDVLELELNRVVIAEPSTPTTETMHQSRHKAKEYDLNVNDKFWMSQKGRPFPEVAEAVQEELESYRNSEDEIKRIKHAMGLDGNESDSAISMINDATAKLTNTVSTLPELLERKRLIDLHTNVATAVLQHIKSRKLDRFFEIEEKLLNRQQLADTTSLLDVLKESDCGSVEDKLRLFLLNYILCSDGISASELKQQMTHLEGIGADDAAVKFVLRWKSLSKMSVHRDDYLGAGTKTVSMFSKLLNQSSQLVMEGVKNLVPKKHNLPVTKIVDAIMEAKANPDTDSYRYFDPKLMRSVDSGTPRTRAPVNEAIVFVIGGGNYVEYQNLVDYYRSQKSQAPANQLMGRRITYGATELVNASQFLAQLTRLGQEM